MQIAEQNDSHDPIPPTNPIPKSVLPLHNIISRIRIWYLPFSHIILSQLFGPIGYPSVSEIVP